MALSNSARLKQTFDVPELDLKIDREDEMPAPISRANSWNVDGVWAENLSFDLVDEVLDSSQAMLERLTDERGWDCMVPELDQTVEP